MWNMLIWRMDAALAAWLVLVEVCCLPVCGAAVPTEEVFPPVA